MTTARFAASSNTVRAAFAGLAVVVTFSVLGGMTQIASAQAKDVELAQARSEAALMACAAQADEAPLQIVVVTGKRV